MAKRGRKGRNIEPDELKKYARLGLTVAEIAACINISQTALYEHFKKKPKLVEAIEQGRAELVASCAQVVIKAAVGETKQERDGSITVVKEADPKYALEVTRRFGGRWKDTPIVESVTVNNAPGVDGKASEIAAALGEDAMIRMSRAFLRSRGVDVE